LEDERFRGVVLVKDGEQKTVSFDELCLSNTMSLEALVALLVKKKVIKPNELLDAIRDVKNQRFRAGTPPQGAREQ
jgi:hypothetical protein